MTRAPYEPDQMVEVRWEGDRWLEAKVYRVYDNGADVIVFRAVGVSAGLHYVRFSDIRLVTS